MNTITSSRLTSVLSALSRSEWRHFKRFILSGAAGPPGKSLELYDYLSDFHPVFAGPEMSKTAIFNAIFINEIYHDKKLRYALTDLYRYACSFLRFKALEDHNEEGNYLLGTILAQRQADKAYLAHYQTDGNQLNLDADRGAESYFHAYRKEFVHLNHFLPRQKRSDQNPIGTISRNLDVFFVAKKLQLLCEIVNVKNVMSVHHDFLLQEKIIEMVENGVFNDVPVIIIYYRILMTLLNPDDEKHFDTLSQLLKSHENVFKKPELRDMYQYLMNYCIKKINQGVSLYISTLADIYKIILTNKVIYNGQYLSQWDFKNMVVVGIRAGEQEWVKQFIENYHQELFPAERSNARIYNLAYYYFSTGEYRSALSLLQQVEFTDLYYQLDMRAILLKCYFEMDDQETFFYHIAAFRIFLSRNKLVSDYQRTIYRNMIRFSTKLIRANGDKTKATFIQKQIEEVKQIADINWLRNKAALIVA